GVVEPHASIEFLMGEQALNGYVAVNVLVKLHGFDRAVHDDEIVGLAASAAADFHVERYLAHRRLSVDEPSQIEVRCVEQSPKHEFFIGIYFNTDIRADVAQVGGEGAVGDQTVDEAGDVSFVADGLQGFKRFGDDGAVSGNEQLQIGRGGLQRIDIHVQEGL